MVHTRRKTASSDFFAVELSKSRGTAAEKVASFKLIQTNEDVEDIQKIYCFPYGARVPTNLLGCYIHRTCHNELKLYFQRQQTGLENDKFIIKVVDNCDLNTTSLDGKGSLHYVNTLFIQCNAENSNRDNSQQPQPQSTFIDDSRRPRNRRFKLKNISSKDADNRTVRIHLQSLDNEIITQYFDHSITLSKVMCKSYECELLLRGLTHTNMASSMYPMPFLSGFFSKYICLLEISSPSNFVYGSPITHVASSKQAIEEIMATTKISIVDSKFQ
ncbi:unnamed protein product [Didymodactylos carnosus]|uniref:Uncharacterized protein n=1 Tax=Didymodactylos carnosus TaxID=1234261 RepID=A0A814PXG8_9BILA|nr:unnamed protein product [Didymodactylos carnosus]CAF3876145.1 unnamed protein product [Didymodactylos carnosus]